MSLCIFCGFGGSLFAEVELCKHDSGKDKHASEYAGGGKMILTENNSAYRAKHGFKREDYCGIAGIGQALTVGLERISDTDGKDAAEDYCPTGFPYHLESGVLKHKCENCAFGGYHRKLQT